MLIVRKSVLITKKETVYDTFKSIVTHKLLTRIIFYLKSTVGIQRPTGVAAIFV